MRAFADSLGESDKKDGFKKLFNNKRKRADTSCIGSFLGRNVEISIGIDYALDSASSTYSIISPGAQLSAEHILSKI